MGKTRDFGRFFSGRDFKVVIAATFTAEPILTPLKLFLKDVQFANYNQILGELNNSHGSLARNSNGFNVVLLCFEDWLRFNSDCCPAELERQFEELISAILNRSDAHRKVPLIVCSCPASPQSLHHTLWESFDRQLKKLLKVDPEITALTPEDVFSWYPHQDYYDAIGDREGHIPYRDTFFSALALTIVRTIAAATRSPYKVIVLDCDNTLWTGIAGEDGAHKLTVSADQSWLHNFLKTKQNQGFLLCLNSKNEEADVNSAFQVNHKWAIRIEDFIAKRVNWRAKSENIRSLAQELNLGLDSFIFIDDNPMECAEVNAAHPDILTICLADVRCSYAQFFSHFWPLDRIKSTEEDLHKMAQYREELSRTRESEKNGFESFINSLELKITTHPLINENLVRLAQLTRKVNQFNLSGKKRSETELNQFARKTNSVVLAVSARDRFGDYGTVGLTAMEWNQSAVMTIDTFLLSCRALGRGVEHEMVAIIGKLALKQDCVLVKFPYLRSERNAPIWIFFEALKKRELCIEENGVYIFSAQQAADAKFNIKDCKTDNPRDQIQHNKISASVNFNNYSVLAIEIANTLNSAEAINEIVFGKNTGLHEKHSILAFLKIAAENLTQNTDVDLDEELQALGLDSLRTLQLMTRVYHNFALVPEDISPSIISHECNTLRKLGSYIEKIINVDAHQYLDKEISGVKERVLGSSEQLVYLLHKYSEAFPLCKIDFSGVFEKKKFVAAIAQLEKRFPTLNGRTIENNNRFLLSCEGGPGVKVVYCENSHWGDTIANSLKDLTAVNAPPLQIFLFANNKAQSKTTMVMLGNHLFVDGSSLKAILRNLLFFYEDNVLAVKSSSKQFLAPSSEEIFDESLSCGLMNTTALSYIKSLLKPGNKIDSKRYLEQGPDSISHNHSVVTLHFDKEETETILHGCAQNNISLTALACSALAAGMHACLSQLTFASRYNITVSYDLRNYPQFSKYQGLGYHVDEVSLPIRISQNDQAWQVAKGLENVLKNSFTPERCAMRLSIKSKLKHLASERTVLKRYRSMIFVGNLGVLDLPESSIGIDAVEFLMARPRVYNSLFTHFYTFILKDQLHLTLSSNVSESNLNTLSTRIKQQFFCKRAGQPIIWG